MCLVKIFTALFFGVGMFVIGVPLLAMGNWIVCLLDSFGFMFAAGIYADER